MASHALTAMNSSHINTIWSLFIIIRYRSLLIEWLYCIFEYYISVIVTAEFVVHLLQLPKGALHSQYMVWKRKTWDGSWMLLSTTVWVFEVLSVGDSMHEVRRQRMHRHHYKCAINLWSCMCWSSRLVISTVKWYVMSFEQW